MYRSRYYHLFISQELQSKFSFLRLKLFVKLEYTWRIMIMAIHFCRRVSC